MMWKPFWIVTKEEAEKLRAPHRWFAWYPVSLTSGHTVWLETVERTVDWRHSADGTSFSVRIYRQSCD